MYERTFDQIREGMDCFDVDGDKIGTIGRVYQPTGVPGGMTTGPGQMGPMTTPPGTTPGGAMPMGEGHIRVDTGFLGLGKDLYIPFSAIRDVRSEGVYLNVDKDEVDRMGWDQAPAYIHEEGY